MAQIINVVVDDPNEIINVTVTDGLITQSGGGTFISGWWVKKGAGNVGASIEEGDYVDGWLDDVRVAGKVNNLPLNDVSDLDIAVQGEIL